jgi:hypothetical protein
MEIGFANNLTEYNSINPRVVYYLTTQEYLAVLNRINQAWSEKSLHRLRMAMYSIPSERKLVQELYD